MRDATDMMNEAVDYVTTQFPLTATENIRFLLNLAAIKGIQLATADFKDELASRPR